MRHNIEPGHFTRSFTIGFIILLFSTGLVACGPGEPTVSSDPSLVQGEVAPLPTPAESEIKATQSIATTSSEEAL